VSLVPHDAREGESLHAALDALVRLSDVANSTFSRITDRFAHTGGMRAQPLFASVRHRTRVTVGSISGRRGSDTLCTLFILAQLARGLNSSAGCASRESKSGQLAVAWKKLSARSMHSEAASAQHESSRRPSFQRWRIVASTRYTARAKHCECMHGTQSDMSHILRP